MKKYIIIILLALAIGGGLSFYFLKDLRTDNNKNNKNTSIAQAFQVGVFTNYDNANKIAQRNNGIVVNDNNLYRVYIAVSSNEDVIKKLKNYYDSIGLNYYLKEVDVSTTFNKEVSDYEKMLLKSSTETYGTINLDVLHKYQQTSI